MLTVIPFCRKDAQLAALNLELAAKLDGPVPFDCLLSYDTTAADQLPEIQDRAAKVFRTVHVHKYYPWRGAQTWPTLANYAWQQTARHIEHTFTGKYRGWLWWEADATPLKAGWIATLASAYRKGNQPFAGYQLETAGERYMNGVGIWPVQISFWLPNSGALIARALPFDRVAGCESVKRMTVLNGLIAHVIKERGFGQGLVFDRANWQQWRQEHSDAVLFHGCADGSLANILLGRGAPEAPAIPDTGYLSVDLGDVIYNLPAFRALGISTIYLGPDNRSGWPDREPMTEPRANVILPLLRAQPWIVKAEFAQRIPAGVKDMNAYRASMKTPDGKHQDLQPGWNLARVPLKHWGLPLDLDKQPWLIAPNPQKIAKVIIARSSRYQNPDFQWKRLLTDYKGDVAFVGLQDEHRAFSDRYGTVPYYATKDLLELANVIAGADLFVGNQSAPFAVAMGLGKDAVLESCPGISNTLFERNNLTVGYQRPIAQKATELIVAAPIENFTGYGQLTCAFCAELEHRNLPFQVAPLCYSDSITPVPKVVQQRINRDAVPNFLISPLPDIPRNLKSGQALMTMWESDRIAPDVVQAINQRARGVIVPSQWNATAFSASGVNVPISVVPLGMDPDVYHYIKPTHSPTVRFGCAGRVAHAGPRKAIDKTIQWFLEAFPTQKNVELHVKVFTDCPVDAHPDKRIVFERRFLDPRALAQWYASLDAFICCSTGEGWGLHPHQAIAVGRPVLAPRYGGLAEFVSLQNSYLLRFKLVKAAWGPYTGLGNWASVDSESLITSLRWIYRHRAQNRLFGVRAAKTVTHLTWANMAEAILQALADFGIKL